MSDPYRLDDPAGDPPHRPASTGHRRERPASPLRVVWWVVLVISVAGNAAGSLAGQTLPALGLGLVTVGMIVLLVRDALRRRG